MSLIKRNQKKRRNNKKLFKKIKKQVQGITLIALVVTVIILLILAGVALSLTVGNNGLFRRAQNAADTWQIAEQNEQSEMDEAVDFIDNYVTGINIEQVTDENPGVLEIDEQNIDTYIINSIEDLVFFSYDVTTNGITYEGKTVKLGTNLNFSSNKSYVNPNSTDYEKYGYSGPIKQALTSGTGFSPIGGNEETNSFHGIFDGDNKAICSLYQNINTNEKSFGGFFISNYGEIKNLGLVNVNIISLSQGENSASVGGIARLSYNKIINCYVTGNIKTEGGSWMAVGGICGALASNNCIIENCYNLANIECKNIQTEHGESNISCGGILGQTANGGIINKCFNKGNISVDGGNNEALAGGICGNFYGNTASIRNSYNNAKIECTSKSFADIGGIAAWTGLSGQSFSIENCYNSGEIIGDAENGRISGVVGLAYDFVEINNVFNAGKITLKNGNYIEANNSAGAGGIVAVLAAGANNIEMNNAYNTGVIELENTINQRIGSIIGNRKATISLNNCYYLKESYDVSVGYGDTTGITELDSISDFPSILEIVNAEGVFVEDTNNVNNGYPILTK